MRKRWTGLATSVVLIASALAVQGTIAAKANHVPGGSWTLYAAGDIGAPDSGSDELNAALIKDGIAADPDHTRVLMLGDGAYPDGSLATYEREYGKAGSWGDFKDKTYPVPGNHDYGTDMTESNAGYRQYWNARLERDGGGRREHHVRPGRLVLLRPRQLARHRPELGLREHHADQLQGRRPPGAVARHRPGQGQGGEQEHHRHVARRPVLLPERQRRRVANRRPGPRPTPARPTSYWKKLQAAGADIVLGAHHHNYERFDRMSVEQTGAPRTSRARSTPTACGSSSSGRAAGGLMKFTTHPDARRQQKKIDDHYGVLKLVLHENTYEWQFLSSGSPGEQPAGTVLDSGCDVHPPQPRCLRRRGGTTSPPLRAGRPRPRATTNPSNRKGYWMVGADGKVYGFGTAQKFGDAGLTPGTSAVDLEPTPTGDGYWVVDDAGGVASFGDAIYRGSPDSMTIKADEKVTSISSTSTGKGYWMFTNKGRVLAFGDATHFGDMAGKPLNAPVLDSIVTPSGKGYYMVAGDGGIFSFGDAKFYGSMGGKPLNKPVQSLVPDSDGVGYWLVASDGGIFAFDAPFRGSMGGTPLNKPVTGMVRFADGYLMVGEDGGIFNFSSQQFLGSLGSTPPAHPIVSVAALG